MSCLRNAGVALPHNQWWDWHRIHFVVFHAVLGTGCGYMVGPPNGHLEKIGGVDLFAFATSPVLFWGRKVSEISICYSRAAFDIEDIWDKER